MTIALAVPAPAPAELESLEPAGSVARYRQNLEWISSRAALAVASRVDVLPRARHGRELDVELEPMRRPLYAAPRRVDGWR